MNKQILRLAVPNVISNLSVPLLGVIDTAVVGHLEHIYYLGAIAVGSIIFDFIFWGFGFLRMGTTGLVAQAFGAGDERETRILLIRVLSVAAIASVLILLLQYPLIEISLLIVNASPEVEAYTRLYYHIRIFAAPATLALFSINGWFLGMQNSTYPMIITIVLNICNIGLNLLFVFQFGMNVDGVAWGSLVASYIGLLLAILLYKKKYSTLSLSVNILEIFKTNELYKFFSVNRDIFIRTLCLIFSYAFFTAKSAESGDIVLAANTILLQLWYISAYGIDGFAFAAESLVGRFTGAGDTKKLNQSIKYSILWGLGIGIASTLVYALFGKGIITLFTDKSEVIQAATIVLTWTIIAPLINSICFIWDGVYIGATETVIMRNSMLIATILCFLPAYYIAEPLIGGHALWFAMTFFMLVRGVTLTAWAPKRIFLPSITNPYLKQ